MKKLTLAVAALSALAVLCPGLSAQEKLTPEVKAPATTLKLHVTIVEHEGEKKVTNLPYTFFLRAGGGGPASPWTKLRTGSRVPVYVGKDGGMQYIDVGTNIDARGVAAEDGRFDISLNLERSWVEGEVDVATGKSSGAPADPNSEKFKQPIIRQFKTELTLPMRDGQTTESTEAADPGGGRILTLTVTMNVAK
jgi:hypothetical protein